MNILSGKKILITAGPTREYIDPVRYISNDSSGQMGVALAEAARRLGAKITLISGPANPPIPPFFKGGKILSVVSAMDMFAVVKKYYKQADIIIMAAAVADFRPVRYSGRKLKKTIIPPSPHLKKGGFTIAPSNHRTIELVPTPDILHWLGIHKRPHQLLIGFALETEDLIKNAKAKLRQKNCDLIVANHAKTIGQSKASAIIIKKDGTKLTLTQKSKSEIAKVILEFIMAT